MRVECAGAMVQVWNGEGRSTLLGCDLQMWLSARLNPKPPRPRHRGVVQSQGAPLPASLNPKPPRPRHRGVVQPQGTRVQLESPGAPVSPKCPTGESSPVEAIGRS
ncbi:hypothetical protein T484DRAFT_2856440 [Baffinella frigidus]|nr:hypothetical protein T484DRAFT_2856440 [Cryptophyta sp. CCMP2293]